MSRRYALIDKSRDPSKPDSLVIITKKYKLAKAFLVEESARKDEKGIPYPRYVVELPVKFREPPDWFNKILAMQMNDGMTEITDQDALASFCVNCGKVINANVDLQDEARRS